MMHYAGMIFFLAIIVPSTAAMNKSITEGDIDVTVFEQSGRMMFGRSTYEA